MFGTIEIPVIGSYIDIKGQMWEIVQVDVKLTKRTDAAFGHEMVAMCTLQAIDAECEEMDIPQIQVNLDAIDYKEV